MSKVNVFIIGAPKCGTTSLVDYLNQLNDVSKMVPKEPYYWSLDIPMSKHEISSPDLTSYESLVLDDSAQYVIDGSTRYLRSEVAPKLVQEYNPNAKIIVMLRNPVDVAHAYHMEQIFCGHESETSFEKAWRRKEGDRLPANCNGYNYLDYKNTCMFGAQIKRWRQYFNHEQIHVINFDEFKSDTNASFKRVVEFIGLDAVDFEGVDLSPKNVSHARKNRHLANFVLYKIGFVKPVLDQIRIWMNSNPDSFLSKVKKKVFHAEKKRTPIDNDLRKDMEAIFLSDQELLNELVGFKHIH